MPRALIAFFWVVTVVAAFVVGRITQGSDSDLNGMADGNGRSSSILGSAANPMGSQTKDGAAAEDSARKKPNIAALIANVRLQIQGSSAMMNPSAMLKVMAPLADLTSEEIVEALAEVERTIQAPQQKMMLYSMLLGRMAETDGPAALAYAEEHLSKLGPMGQGAKMSAMSTWASSDPEGAWEYYQKQKVNDPDSGGVFGGNRMMLPSIFSAMMAGDNLDGALKRLEGLEDTDRQMAISGLVQRGAWDESQRESLLDVADTLDEETGLHLRSQLISHWAMMDADSAVDWVISQPEEKRGNLLQSATGALIMTNPRKGAETLVANASEEQLPSIYATVVSQWAHQDPNAAGEWLAEQPQGAELDQARRHFSNAVAGRDPESAMAWAQTVVDPEIRTRAIQSTYQQWSQRDADAANAALQNAGLTEDQMQQIRPGERTPQP